MGPRIDDGKPIKRNGSGSKTIIIVAKIVPRKLANPPIITINKIGIKFIKVKDDGSIKVI